MLKPEPKRLKKIQWDEMDGLVTITAYINQDGHCADWGAEGWNGEDLSHRFKNDEVSAEAEDRFKAAEVGS